MTVKERLDKVLEIKDYNPEDYNALALDCKIIPNSLTKAIKRDSLSPDMIDQIHENLGIAKKFLREGMGPILDMTLEVGKREEKYTMQSDRRDLIEHLKQKIDSLEKDKAHLQKTADELMRKNQELVIKMADLTLAMLNKNPHP